MSAPEAEQFLAFYHQLVDAVSKSASNCGAMTTAVNGVIDTNQPVVQASWAAKKAAKQLPKDVQKSMEKRAKELVAGLRPCLNDGGVKTAFERLKPPKEPPPAAKP